MSSSAKRYRPIASDGANRSTNVTPGSPGYHNYQDWIGVGMALAGFGAWSLVGQQVANAIVSVVMLWAVTPWRPSFEFSREDFRELMLGIVLVMYSGFLLFIIFPAGPPRFAIAHLFDPPRLTGRFGLFEATQGAWDNLNPIKVHASFPSLHCAFAVFPCAGAAKSPRGDRHTSL